MQLGKRVIPDPAFGRSVGVVWNRSSARLPRIELLADEAARNQAGRALEPA